MKIKKGEIFFAKAFIDKHLARIIDWAVGDIRRCCRMNPDGTCANNGALVGAFILWCCAIDYFGGLYSGFTSKGATKARFQSFIRKYMSRYDANKVEDLRWSLSHYYSPHHFILYHENDLESNRHLHLTPNDRGIMLHLGWAIKDLENAVNNYHQELKTNDQLKIKAWRYYKEQLPIMPVNIETLVSKEMSNLLDIDTSQSSITASGTVSQKEWFNS